MTDRLNAKLSSVNDLYAEKYPNAHKKTSHYFHTLREVWQETFPDAEQKAQDKFSARRERARIAREWEEKQKDMTQEELEALEKDIPEWKRGALVLSEDAEDEFKKKKPGVLKKLKGAVTEKIA